MKLLLLLTLSTFYLVGCGKSEEVVENFSITHSATDDEDVFMYLQQPEEGLKTRYNYSKFKVAPGECIGVSEDQFSKLVVIVGEDWDTGHKTLCGDSDENKCQANNYNVVDVGEGLDDIYELQAVVEETADAEDVADTDAEDTTDDASEDTTEVVADDTTTEEATVECVAIEEWMTAKDPKAIVATTKTTDDTEAADKDAEATEDDVVLADDTTETTDDAS